MEIGRMEIAISRVPYIDGDRTSIELEIDLRNV